MKQFIEIYKEPKYFSKRIILMALCIIHDFTKYHTARSVQDVFYWPDGLCPDMVVVGAFFAVMILCIWEDCNIMRKMIGDAAGTLIEAMTLVGKGG